MARMSSSSPVSTSAPRQPHRAPSSPGNVVPARAVPRRHHYRPGDRRLALALPAAALLLALAIWPLLQLGSMSLHQLDPGTINQDWPFAGFDNFANVFAEPGFAKVVGNTLVFVVIVTGIGLVGGFANQEAQEN